MSSGFEPERRLVSAPSTTTSAGPSPFFSYAIVVPSADFTAGMPFSLPLAVRGGARRSALNRAECLAERVQVAAQRCGGGPGDITILRPLVVCLDQLGVLLIGLLRVLIARLDEQQLLEPVEHVLRGRL